MDIPVETVGDVTVATIPVEELDASNAAELKRDLAPVLAASRHVVIDLGRVRFVDSSGLGVMLSCLRALSAAGGTLKLCGMTRQVRAVFDLVRLHRIVDVYPTRGEALAAFALPTGKMSP